MREPDEFAGELGHIPGALLITLRELPTRAGEVAACKERSIVVVCRSGVRGAAAAAILTGLGLDSVPNRKGGMIEWREQGFAVER